MRNKKISIIVIAIAVVLAVLAILLKELGVFSKKDEIDLSNIPTPGQLTYGLHYKGEISHDVEVMRMNLMNESAYLDYDLKKKYKSIYQITDEESEREVCEYLGIQSELVDIDYSEKNLLLSIGCSINDIIKASSVAIDGKAVDLLRVTYNEKEYTEGKIYVYSSNKNDILAGKALERYYWENVSELCNFVESDYADKTLIQEGSYHKLYLKREGLYELLLNNAEGNVAIRKVYTDTAPEVKEISDRMTEIKHTDITQYFNALRGGVSKEFTLKTYYLKYNIIGYVGMYDGEIQLRLQDAYDTRLYGRIHRLPFARVSEEEVESLVKSISVVDDTHIEVEYINSDNMVVIDIVTVVNMNV